MLMIISGELAIDLDQVVKIEREDDGSIVQWRVRFHSGGDDYIRDSERMRIWEIL